MMDRNLGATSATRGNVGTYGLLYQWGRKDPFMGSCATSGTTLAASTGSWNTVSSEYSMDYAEENPMTYITYIWDGGSLPGKAWHTSELEKGLYDPCPVGYRVPDGGENGFWATADILSTEIYSDGIYWQLADGTTAAWYPAAGARDYYTGALREVNMYGYYWSSARDLSNGNAYNLEFFYSIYPAYNKQCSYGYSVRCVKEK